MQQLVELTKSTGNRLLFDLNLQFRYGQQWDPSNAIELMQFFSDLGYGDNIDWELGNGLTIQLCSFQISRACMFVVEREAGE